MATQGQEKQKNEWLGPKKAAGGIAARALEGWGDARKRGIKIMSLEIELSPEQVNKSLAEAAEQRKSSTNRV